MLPIAIAVEMSSVIYQAMTAVVVVANARQERAFRKLLKCDSLCWDSSCFIFIKSVIVLAKNKVSLLRSLR